MASGFPVERVRVLAAGVGGTGVVGAVRRAGTGALIGSGVVLCGTAVAWLSYATSPLIAVGLVIVLAFVVLAAVRPVLAVCGCSSLAVLEAQQVPLGGLGALSATEVAFCLVAAGWVWRALTGAPDVRYPEFADYPLVGFVLALLPGVALGAPPAVVARLLLMWTAFYLVYLTVRGFSPAQLRRVVLALGLGAGALAAMGLITYVRGGGADVTAGGAVVSGRAAYGIPDPNYFAAYLQLAAAPALALVVAGRSRWRPAMTVAVLLCGVAIVATLSRGAILAALIAVGVVVMAWSRTRVVTVGVALVVVCATAVNLNPLVTSTGTEVVAERLSSIGTESSNNKRPLIWSRSLELIQEQPLGVGALQFREVSGRLGLTEGGARLENVHNAYLNIAVELGVLGLIAYLAWTARVARDLVYEWRRRRPETFPLVVGVTAALSGYVFQALTIVQYRVQTILAVLFVLAGVAAAARGWAGQPERGRELPRRDPATVGA